MLVVIHYLIAKFSRQLSVGHVFFHLFHLKIKSNIFNYESKHVKMSRDSENIHFFSLELRDLQISHSCKSTQHPFRILEYTMLISFEIMLNFAQNSRFKFTDCLFYCITTTSPLVSGHLSYFESWVFVEVLLSLVVFLYLGP